MLRGNHECRQMTTFFNFRTECLYKYDQDVYDLFMDSFDLMPLACVINGKFLALHGGISPELKTLDDINKIDRFKEPPKQGIFCDLLWSDPVDNEEGACENIFKTNSIRGCSYFFGNDAVTKFLTRNNLLCLIRAHEAQIEGFKMHTWTKKADFPAVITVFSAPNYCDVYNNKGAIITFENSTLNIQQFNYTPHPYILPNFMDIFSWSLPFVSEKTTEMLFHLVKVREGESDDDDDDDDDDDEMGEIPNEHNNNIGSVKLQKRGSILRNKIKFVSKMLALKKGAREESEAIVASQIMSTDNRIPISVLTKGGTARSNSFKTAKQADQLNEKMPEL